MLFNRSCVPLGAFQEFTKIAAHERTRGNIWRSPSTAPIRRDPQILVRCPKESRHLLDDQPERPFVRPISFIRVKRSSSLENSRHLALIIADEYTLYLQVDS